MKTILTFVKACYQTYAKWYESRTWRQKAAIYAFILSVISCLIAYFLFGYVFSLPSSNQSAVYDGDTVTISSTQNQIEVSVYSENLPGGVTQLWQGQTLILETVEGAKPGYYQYTGVINPGEYNVVGQTALIVLPSDAVIDNQFEVERNYDIRNDMTKFMFFVTYLIGYVAGRGLYRPRP